MEFTFYFNTKNEPKNKGEIKIRCYLNRRYRYAGTGVYIESKYWDMSTGYISKKFPQYAAASKILEDKIKLLKDAAFDIEARGGVFDFDMLKETTGKKQGVLVSDFMTDSLNEEKGLDLKTIVKYKTNINVISEILPDMRISVIVGKDIEKLDAELRKKYAQSTVARMHVFVEKYVKKAVKKGILTVNPYDKVDLNMYRGEARKVYLTADEIKSLEELQEKDLPINHKLVLDRYLYSIYTGLRISDNLALKKSMITDTDDGYMVNLHTIKGYGSDLIHPLKLMFDGKPDKIVRYYINKHDADTLFPVQSRTYISTVLDILAEMAKIDKKLTFHTSRHTCATQLAEITQNPFLLMNLMGWKDIRIAMNYIHASNENTKRQLRVFMGKW